MKIYENLPKEELELLLDAPALVTVLIGGADGDLDEKEVAWGKKLTQIRADREDSFLQDYYEDVNENFKKSLVKIVEKFPPVIDAEENCKAIATELEKLNAIYKKLDKNFVNALNKSLRSFAQQIAEASGGVLGFGSESYEEEQWINLSMLK